MMLRLRRFVAIALLCWTCRTMIWLARLPTEQDTSNDYHHYLWSNATTSSLHRGKDSDYYLVYYSHSGFSNQLLGLQRAAELAVATHRILVLPPVLPHLGDPHVRFPHVSYRIAEGRGCHNHSEYLHRMHTDFMNVLNGQDFPSFSELIDWETLLYKNNNNNSNATLQVIDLPEFVHSVLHDNPNEIHSLFFANQLPDLDGKCTKDRRSYAEMVDYFHTLFDGQPVAVIGSAFFIANAHVYSELGLAFDSTQVVLRFPLTTPLQVLLDHIHQHVLPTDYAGLHIRFPDGIQLKCSRLRKRYHKIAAPFASRNTSMVFVGRSHQLAQPCFEQSVPNIPSTALPQLMNKDSGIMAQSLLDKIRLEESTVQLVVDQLVLASAGVLVLHQFQPKLGSTFQTVLRLRRRPQDPTILV